MRFAEIAREEETPANAGAGTGDGSVPSAGEEGEEGAGGTPAQEGGEGTPSDPTEPIDPTAPTDPTDPTDPTSPTEEPEEPEEPALPPLPRHEAHARSSVEDLVRCFLPRLGEGQEVRTLISKHTYEAMEILERYLCKGECIGQEDFYSYLERKLIAIIVICDLYLTLASFRQQVHLLGTEEIVEDLFAVRRARAGSAEVEFDTRPHSSRNTDVDFQSPYYQRLLGLKALLAARLDIPLFRELQTRPKANVEIVRGNVPSSKRLFNPAPVRYRGGR